jgi:hypothetical protein
MHKKNTKKSSPKLETQDSTTRTLVIKFDKQTPLEDIRRKIDDELEPTGRKIRILEKLPYENKRNSFVAEDSGEHDYYYLSTDPDLFLKQGDLAQTFKNLNCYSSKEFRVIDTKYITMRNRDIGPTKEDLLRTYAIMRSGMIQMEERLKKLEQLQNKTN